MINLIEDLSKVSTLSIKSLQDAISIAELCISHAILEAKLNNESIVDIDMTFGKLHIKLSEGEVAYKFIPSKHFEKMLVKTLQTNESELVKAVENSLTNKVLSAYKELL